MVYAFARRLERETVIVIFNAASSSTRLKLRLPEVGVETLRQIWPEGTGRSYAVTQGRLEITLPGREAVILMG